MKSESRRVVQRDGMLDFSELSDANEFDASLDEDTMNESDIVFEGTSSKHCTLEIEDFEKGGPVWIVNWKMTDDLSEIAQKYATKWQCSKQCVRLSTKENDSEIAFDQSPQQLSFVANGITQLLVRQMKQFARPEDNPNLVKIVFQSQNGNVSKWIPKV
ncbi:unnamed protein product [Anisakis simplex]|uniref:Rad60-SLD domain-containing protein n=1 Tax=Anisakis simplex TaxID=6269 RepID=A0A0M3KB02_ANISI|nr:unnamed protein product [Anisakis simplex]